VKLSVIAGLDPAIHAEVRHKDDAWLSRVALARLCARLVRMDGRVKPGGDEA